MSDFSHTDRDALPKSPVRSGALADLPALARRIWQDEGAVDDALKSLRTAGHASDRGILAEALATQGCRFPFVYTGRLAELKAELAGPLTLARRADNTRQAIGLLYRALDNLPDAAIAAQQLHYRLAQALFDLGRDDELAPVGHRLFERCGDRSWWREIGKVVALLQWTGVIDGMLEITQRLWAAAPDNPEFALCHAKQLAACEAPRQAQYSVLEHAIGAHPQHLGLLQHLARAAAQNNRFAEAQVYYERLIRLQPISSNFWHLGEVLLRRGRQDEALGAFAQVALRLEAEDLGALAPVLARFRFLCNRNHHYQDRIDAAALGSTLQASCRRLDDHLAKDEAITPAELLAAAHALSRLERTFGGLKHLRANTDFTLGELHGTLDLEAFGALSEAVYAHIAIMLRHALSERLLCRPLKSPGVIRNLAALHTAVQLTLQRPAAAREKLDWLAANGFGAAFAARLSALVRLHEREITPPLAEDRSGGVSGHVPHRMAPWEEWVAAEGLRRGATLATAPGQECGYAVVTADGKLRRGAYRLRPFRLYTVAGKPVTLRDSELLLGPHGRLFQPHPFHGPYPRASESVVERGPRAVFLRAAGATSVIEEPAVILANNDAYRIANYTHWLIFILCRLGVLLDQGLLQTRKVLLPAEIRPWMRESLALIGLGEDRILFYPRDHRVVVADAEIVSPVEFVGCEQLRALRSRMWAGAGVDAAGTASGFVFLARKTQLRRMILDEDRIHRIAERNGFRVVSPESLSVAAQVRLFSQTAGLTGPGGSAFTNILFSRAGTRVLHLSQEETYSQLWLYLSTACGVDFRWLLGRSHPAVVRYRYPIGAPYRVDPGHFERQLAWVREAREPC
ncbi:MAG: DUF563 domain-containing protein [Alphaproteobacteria bacterium]|nr:DUF563 domain-containing protein [Alphaproteobacteria bacterium]